MATVMVPCLHHNSSFCLKSSSFGCGQIRAGFHRSLKFRTSPVLVLHLVGASIFKPRFARDESGMFKSFLQKRKGGE